MTETLGYRLKRERTLRQLSQEALAKALTTEDTSINKSMISRWERDLDTPSTKNLRRLAEYFDRPLDYFLCDEDISFPNLSLALSEICEHTGATHADLAEAINIPEEDLSRYEAEEEISTHLLAELFRKFMMPGIFSSLNANSKIAEYGHAPSEDGSDTAFSNADLIDYMTRTELGNQLREKNAQSHLYEIPLLSSAAFAHARTTADGTLTGFWVAADYDETITLSIDTGATFCLRAPDDAMAAAGIRTDDLVFVKKQLIMDDGEIAVVLVPGDDGAATRLLVRRVYHTPGSTQLQLTADDRSYPPLLVDLFENGGAKILGKVTYTLTQPR